MDDITVIGPDGAKHSFPAGTTSDVINNTLGRHYQSGPAEQAAVTSAVRGGGRSQGRRFETNAVDGANRSMLGQMERDVDTNNDGFDRGDFNRIMGGFGKLQEGTPLDWLLDRTVGSERTGIFQSVDINPETSASNRAERRRRENYEAAAEADPIANPLDFASFLGGQIVGGALSPENWIGGGGGRVAGTGARVAFTNLARQAAEQAVIAGVTDVALQGNDVANDVQDEFSLMQTATSALVGGTVGGAISAVTPARPGPKPTADTLVREAVTAAEATFGVPLHEGDVSPSAVPARVGSLPAGATDIVRIEGGGALPGDVWDPALNAWVHRVDGPTTEAAPSPLTSPPIEADGTIRLTHGSSTAGLTALDPNQGFSGASSASERNDGSPAKNFFGIGEGQPGGYQRERQIGPNRYETTVSAERMYDADANPLNLPRESTDFSMPPAYQQAIKDAGFEGFWSAKAHPAGMIAATFDVTPVTPIRTAEVAVEVAPDPNNVELTGRWNNLLPRERQGISRDVIQAAVGQTLKDLGVAGQRREVLGGYLDETNPAYIVTVDDPGRADEVAKYLGHVLDQDSMLVSSEVPTGTSAPTGVVTITPPPSRAYESGLRDLYTKLRLILVDGEPIVSGHQSANGRMALYNFSNLDNETFAARVAEALDGTHGISLGEINTSFINRKDYGHGNVDGRPGQAASGRSPAQGNLDNLRGQTAKQLEDLIAAAEARSAPRARNQDIAQPVADRAPTAPEAPPRAAEGSGGGGGSTPPPRDGAGAAPPPEPPKGNGEGGWSDVDWGARGTNPRVIAATKHLDNLRKWIKPAQVSEFLRMLDNGLPDAVDGDYVNMRWVDWDAFKGKPEETVGLQNAIGDIFEDVFKAAGRKLDGQSHNESQRLANEMGVSLSDVAKTHADVVGDGGLTPRLLVLRNVFNESAAHARVRIGELQERVKTSMNAADVRELAELLQRTIILGAMDNSASSEVARALNARKIMSRPAVMVNDLQDALNALNGVLDSEGGINTQDDLSTVMGDLARAYDTSKARGLNGRIKTIRAMGALDYINYVAVGSLLSAPISHVRNLTGSPMLGMGDIAARFVSSVTIAPARRALLAMGGKTDRSITVQDTFAHMQGVYQGLGEGLSLGLQALVKGAPIYDNVSTHLHNPQQVPFALTKARMAKWNTEGFTLSTAADVAGVALFEIVRTFGFRASAAGDEFNKALSRRAATNSFAVREAGYRASQIKNPREAAKVYEATLKGVTTEPTATAYTAAQAAFGAGEIDRVTSYSPDSPEFQHQANLQAVDIEKAAAEYARHMAFQGDGPGVRALEQFLRTVPLFRTLAANFVRTPLQLLKVSFRDFNPVTAPIVLAFEAISPKGRARHAEFFRALAGAEDSLTAGPAAELVIGKQAVGAAVMGTIWAYWSQGDLVGAQVPEGDEYAGVRPNSIKVPGVGWVEFTGFAPIADLLGMVADTGNLHRNSQLTSDQSFSVMGAVGVVLRQRLDAMPVLSGVMDLMQAMSGNSLAGENENATGRGMEKAIAGLLLPRATVLGSLLKKVAQGEDPVVRDTRSFLDELRLYLPSTSVTLAAKRDFMGRLDVRDPGTVGVLQVIKTSGPASDPLEVVLHNLASRIDAPWEPAKLSPYLDGQEMTGPETGRLAEIQGQLYRDRRTGRNMEEELRHLISTDEFLDAPRGQQPDLLRDVVTEYRRAGKAAAHNPQSPLYMRDMVARIGPLRAARDASERGLDATAAMRRRGRTYGLLPQDQEALASALAEIN